MGQLRVFSQAPVENRQKSLTLAIDKGKEHQYHYLIARYAPTQRNRWFPQALASFLMLLCCA
jgi:hypothetical protein